MIELRKYPGPNLKGRPTYAWLKIRRNRKTISLRWNVGSIDNEAVPSDAFKDRCEKADFRNKIHNLLNFKLCPNAWLIGCARWGGCRQIDTASGEKMIQVVDEIFKQATINLPVE